MESKLMKFVEKQQKLTDAQLKVLADIGIAAGQLSAATFIVPFVVSEFDVTNILFIIMGAILTLIFWSLSVWLVREVKP